MASIGSSGDTNKYHNSFHFNFTSQFGFVGHFVNNFHGCGVGFWFENIVLAQGAIIGSATLTVTSFSNESGTDVKSRISAYNADNGSIIANVGDYLAKYAARTIAREDWDNISAFVTDTEYTTPDFSAVIQEIVDRPGWVSGNDINIFCEDHDERSTANAVRRIYLRSDSVPKVAKLNVELASPVVGVIGPMFI